MVKIPVSDVSVIFDTLSLSPESETGQDPEPLPSTDKKHYSRLVRQPFFNHLFHQHILKAHKDTVGQMSCSPLCGVITLYYGQRAPIIELILYTENLLQEVRTDTTRRHIYNMTLVLHTCSMQCSSKAVCCIVCIYIPALLPGQPLLRELSVLFLVYCSLTIYFCT